MKKRDSDKNPFEKKNLVKLAPAAVVIAAVAAAGAQAGSSGKEVTAETREVVKSQDLESLLKTAYSYAPPLHQLQKFRKAAIKMELTREAELALEERLPYR